MASEFKNFNRITDNDDGEETTTPSLPKKTLKSAFELVHPVIEEEKLKALEEEQKLKQSIQKVEGERFELYKYAFYGVSIVTLLLFSFKNWFPLVKNPFF